MSILQSYLSEKGKSLLMSIKMAAVCVKRRRWFCE